jgi:tRNA (mo5U34)-methyltransferase
LRSIAQLAPLLLLEAAASSLCAREFHFEERFGTEDMLTTEKHQQGLRNYHLGRFEEAVRLFGEALEEEQTSEVWNDWAAAQLARGSLTDAEDGFRRALNCDPEDAQAAANLAVVLAKRGQSEGAVGMLEEALRKNHSDPALRATIEQLLAQCRAERMRAEVGKIKWWHSIDLGNGIVTPGAYDTRTLVDRIGMPEDLSGLSVLDIGAWDGYISFEAERRGARRVLATDSYVWRNNVMNNPSSGNAGFQFARAALNSKVEDMDIDVMDLSPERVGTFDLVLFLGVLYHLRHPLLALERVRSVSKKLLIMETHIDLPHTQRPAMAFYPGSEANNDPTNWWGPNEACCVEMLKNAGFQNVRVAGRLPAAPVRTHEEISYGRVAFHADV